MLKWINQLIGGERSSRAADEPARAPTEAAAADGVPDAGTEAGEGSAAKAGNATARASGSSAPLPVARQIILNREARILGYEFTLRGHTASMLSTDPGAQQLNDQQLIRTVTSLGADRIAQFRDIWLSISEVSLGNPLIDGLPAKSTVLMVRLMPNHLPSADLMVQVAALREKGFRMGLLGFTDNPAHRSWLEQADYVVLDIPTYAPNELGPAVAQLHELKPALKVYGRRIDSYEGFEYCLTQGFDGFGGRFLTHRESWPPQPPLNPDRVRLCGVLNQLRSGTELSEVAEQLRLAPEISYRFLRYINSAGMGLSTHIASIEQGVLYLGREKLYRWLTLLLFGAADGQFTDRALLEQALTRGRMMELLGADKFNRVQCDELFVVGIFSLFDILLGLPLPMAVRPLQLPTAVAGALLDDSGPYAPFLRVATACDQPDAATDLESLSGGLGLHADQVNDLHLEAVGWAQEIGQGNAPEA